VEALQVFLNSHGFQIAASGAGSPGKETTTFGAATKSALERFQANEGLTNAKPGVLDAPTIAMINSMISNSQGGTTQAATTVVTSSAATTAVTTPVTSTPATPQKTVQVTPKSFTRVLTQGSTGADVQALQVFLNTHGFQIAASGAGSPGKESTTFGAATKAALAQFQQSEGLTNAKSGVLDAPTIALINTILKGQSGN
jgi:peptidoglycan hydrolase-like protein with peptidoglycan-binding domain